MSRMHCATGVLVTIAAVMLSAFSAHAAHAASGAGPYNGRKDKSVWTYTYDQDIAMPDGCDSGPASLMAFFAVKPFLVRAPGNRDH